MQLRQCTPRWLPVTGSGSLAFKSSRQPPSQPSFAKGRAASNSTTQRSSSRWFTGKSGHPPGSLKPHTRPKSPTCLCNVFVLVTFYLSASWLADFVLRILDIAIGLTPFLYFISSIGSLILYIYIMVGMNKFVLLSLLCLFQSVWKFMPFVWVCRAQFLGPHLKCVICSFALGALVDQIQQSTHTALSWDRIQLMFYGRIMSCIYNFLF